MPTELTPISQIRFDALAAYCRDPRAALISHETSWFQANDEQILIVVINEYIDGEYAALLLVKDLRQRYRNVKITKFYKTEEEAIDNIVPLCEQIMANYEESRNQGDEAGKPVDFFTPVVSKERLNNVFRTITELPGYSSAVGIIRSMMTWYEDVDGTFIRQFQTEGFDTRLWELYIFALLTEVRLGIRREHAAPDFTAVNNIGEVHIEATSVNPTSAAHLAPPPMDTQADQDEFLHNYMPIRFGGSLFTKLNHRHQGRRYWELDHVQGKPLIFAIQDFHALGSMSYSEQALAYYLYGRKWKEEPNEAGEIVQTSEVIERHVWGEKNIPSGFFNLPDAENISAVIFNPGATISKFLRMGRLAGFGKPDVRLIHRGVASIVENGMGRDVRFTSEVGSPGYSETWIEGLSVYHNPNAKHPLNPLFFPGAAHHCIDKDGTLNALMPQWHPISSSTQIFETE